MSQFDRIARATKVAALLALGVVVAATPGFAQSAAKTKPAAEANDPAAQKKKAAEQGRASLEAGLKAHQSGKHQLAADQLSTALRNGGLPSGDMARALYTRGLAYKALNKPGLAISDLTSALWLKNGLSEQDRQSAMAERTQAYQLAGLTDNGLGAERAVVENPNVAAKAVPSKPLPPNSVAAKPDGNSASAAAAPTAATGAATSTWSSEQTTVTRQSPDSEAAQDAARARRLAAAPVETNGLDQAFTSRSVASSSAAAPSVSPMSMALATNNTPPVAAPALSAVPADDAGNAGAAVAPSTGLPSIGALPSTVSGFFSNMFGGSTQPTAPSEAQPIQSVAVSPSSAVTPQEPLTTASTGPPAAAVPIAATTQTIVPKSASATTAVKGGKFKLHIAALRSRAEADALAQQIAAKHGGDLAARSPTVDEAVIGSMGTFYRVRVGSYANPDEPRGVCNKLRNSGFDCLVVTN